MDKERRGLRSIRVAVVPVLFAAGLIGPAADAQEANGPIRALPGRADVARSVLPRSQLFGRAAPSQPVDDSAGFALPTHAAEPTEIFEGTLTLNDVAKGGSFVKFSDVFGIVPDGDSPWKHLPPFRFEFVQSASHLIPAVQGLAITGSAAWNYIVGPGRVWQEAGDEGYMRASFPFALIQRNQNCVHNGAMTFLFGRRKSPNVSNVYYQITQETCYPMTFDMWGVVPASYTPAAVPGASKLKADHAGELSHRTPTRPLEALAADFPNANIHLSALTGKRKHPEAVTTAGIVMNGVNYVSGCPTRSGQYAFCGDMRLPSYSIAKSTFAGVALMRLGQLYGSGIYSERIKDFVPERLIQGRWDATTFTHALDMATGNYNLDAYEADENSPTMDKFIVDESLEAKLSDAFHFKQNYAPPGTKWVYQSSATFLVTQAMNTYLQKRKGKGADIFELVSTDVYKPLHVSAGGLTTIRTNNSVAGAPSGYYGLFFTQDDIAKIGDFLNTSGGRIGRTQVLEPVRLNEALFRIRGAAEAGVPILGITSASALGPAKLGAGTPPVPDTRRYARGFWGKHMTTDEFPEYRCDFWVSLMTGYGGNIVALLPNGATFYIFSDAMEFPWVDSVREIAKLAPMCH